jgi:hypothetical protein
MVKVLIYFPLYYNSNSIFRLYDYLKENDTNTKIYDVNTLISNSNSDIDDEAKVISQRCGFFYEKRKNIGGGEGGFLNVIINKPEFIENYDFLVYFEESCEPVCQAWFNKIINQTIEKNLDVIGWDWWWRSKKREFSKTQIIGKGFRIGIINENSELKIKNDWINHKNYDVFGYRHEFICIRVSKIPELLFTNEDLDRNLRKFSKIAFGRTIERMYWKPSWGGVKNMNIQYPLLINQKELPSVFNTNLKLFRELTLKEKTNVGYVPRRLNVRKFNIRYLLYIFYRYSNDIIQYVLIKFSIEYKSLEREKNEKETF